MGQVGNATPPLLAEVIRRAIGEQVFGLAYDGPPDLRIPRRRHILAPERVRAVPKKYRRYGRLGQGLANVPDETEAVAVAKFELHGFKAGPNKCLDQ